MRLAGAVTLIVTLLVSPPGVGSFPAAAHPGGLNSEGCHNNRKTGDYHCHRGSSSTISARPGHGAAGRTGGGAYRNCSEARADAAIPATGDISIATTTDWAASEGALPVRPGAQAG